MPMNSALLNLDRHENVRLVPVDPEVKSAKTIQKSNSGVSEFAGSAKSADPTCYNSSRSMKTGLFENVETNMKRKLHAYVGRSPDGARRVYGQDQDPARAMANAFDAAREYLKDHRPDLGPLNSWSFLEASNGDPAAVQFAKDV